MARLRRPPESATELWVCPDGSWLTRDSGDGVVLRLTTTFRFFLPDDPARICTGHEPWDLFTSEELAEKLKHASASSTSSQSLSLPPYLQRALGKVRETDASLAMFHETQFNRSPARPRRVRPPRSRSCAKVSALPRQEQCLQCASAGSRTRSDFVYLPLDTGTHDALVTKLLTAYGVPKSYIEVDLSKSKK